MSQLTLSELPALLADLHAARRDACRLGIMANHGDELDGAVVPSCRGGDGAGD